jgi:lysyl-tRNA synthetase class 2
MENKTELDEQAQIRLAKLTKFRATGIDPYPHNAPRTNLISEVKAKHSSLAADSHTGEIVSIAGRVMLNRIAGKLIFATLRDGSEDMQIMLTADVSGESALDDWKEFIDLGDQISVTGEVVTTKRGELTVKANSWMLTAKCLHPLPDKHKGLADPEARVRQRYLDLIVRPESRRLVQLRSDAVASVREQLRGRGFTEVETPMLQVMHGGANARPFITHINAYDMKMYMRIAPELYLKRLLVGGIEKIFEINRNFRNEGADSSHNPEFTMLEMYEAFGDYTTMANLTKELVLAAATAVYGSTVVQHEDDEGNIVEHDLAQGWKSIPVCQAISDAVGEEVLVDTDPAKLRTIAAKLDIALKPDWENGQIILELYEHLAEAKTVLPTFYTDFPQSVSPLTKAHRSNKLLAEKWDLVTFGFELATGYSELNDPQDQRDRFATQQALAAAGDDEAMRMDEDFIRALEYGMPPAGGQGMGIERLLMALTGKGIRDTILFPLVKPINND